MTGHAAGAGASGSLGLSNEQAGKIIRDRTVSESRRTLNALPRGGLSPLSGVHGCGEFALVGDLLGGLALSDGELPLGFNARGALIPPIADEVSRSECEQKNRDG